MVLIVAFKLKASQLGENLNWFEPTFFLTRGTRSRAQGGPRPDFEVVEIGCNSEFSGEIV